jgi:general secretion pathway protein G
MAGSKIDRGFTLVEILIVVVILGILAAIVVPQFTNASVDAKRAALANQLQTVRKQIQLYAVHHDGALPKIAGSDWSDLTTPTSIEGSVSAYLCSPARNTLNGRIAVTVVNSDMNYGDAVSAADAGFLYNADTGNIWATNTGGTRVYNEENPSDPNN